LSSSSTVNSSSTVSSSSHPKRRVGPRRRPPQCRPRGPDIHEGLDPELLVEELHPILRMRVCLGQITKGTHQCS
jgi:hypothetical protein